MRITISDMEWHVMKVLWERSPLGAGEIVEALLERDPSWHPKTAQTLIGRLVKKGAIRFEPHESKGRSYLYTPIITEDEAITQEAESFLARLFGGSLKPMLAHFVESKKLSREELDELKQLLDENSTPPSSP